MLALGRGRWAVSQKHNLNQFCKCHEQLGSKGDIVVRALSSHQCGPVQIPVLMPYVGWFCCWFSPFAPRGVSPGTPVFPSPYKPALPNSNSIWNAQFTCFNEFLRTRRSSVGKQIIIFVTITRLHSLGSYFKTYSVLVWLKFEPMTSCSAALCSSNLSYM